MPFDEEDLDPHRECAAEIKRLQESLRKLANYADTCELFLRESGYVGKADHLRVLVSDAYGALRLKPEEIKSQKAPLLWLWKNFVDGRPEYWAFDNPYPIHLDCGDPQTLGEPCGYAIFKESRLSENRRDWDMAKVVSAIKASRP